MAHFTSANLSPPRSGALGFPLSREPAMFDWTIFVPAFLTAAVEWVEAFTIVLAVSLTIGWRAAAGAALAALAALAAMTVATGGALGPGLDVRWLQLIVGGCLLLFGRFRREQ